MSTLEKAKRRLRSIPKDYTYSEAKRLLSQLGYDERTKGKTSGSRVSFFRKQDNALIQMHKPHPGDIMSVSSVRNLMEYLTEKGDL